MKKLEKNSLKIKVSRQALINEIVIRKKDLFMILDAIGKQWKQNKLKNADYLLALNAMKLGMHMQSNRSIEKIFGDMVRAVNALQQLGAFKELAENENMDDRICFFRDRLIGEIKSGKFFQGLN